MPSRLVAKYPGVPWIQQTQSVSWHLKPLGIDTIEPSGSVKPRNITDWYRSFPRCCL
jgi:hypothetical protein